MPNLKYVRCPIGLVKDLLKYLAEFGPLTIAYDTVTSTQGNKQKNGDKDLPCISKGKLVYSRKKKRVSEKL